MSHADLTAADYVDWARFAGLYLLNVSHVDRYRTYQAKISPEGLATHIVFDFLHDNPGGIDLQTWRNCCVYEMADDAAYRVEQTAQSLETIGARRVAAKMRTLKNTSLSGMLLESGSDPMSMMDMMKNIDPARMMEELRASIARAMPEAASQAGIPPAKAPPLDSEIESREQIEHLLDRYVKAQGEALRGDMARHGDPRTAADFDPDMRMRELDRLRTLEYDRENQKEAAEKLIGLTDEIARRLAKDPKLPPSKISKSRRAFLELVRTYAKRPAAELLPEMQAALAKAARLQEKNEDIFRPKPINDEKLLQRLAELGPYDVDLGKSTMTLTWAGPTDLTCDWTTFRLSIQYPARDKPALRALLDAVDRLRRRFGQHQSDLKQQVIEHFEMLREQLEHIGLLDDYDRDDDGNITTESILKNAGAGTIHVAALEGGDADDIAIQVFFGVEWDEEHGLELSIIDEPDEAPAAGAPLPAHVSFHDGGVAVAANVLASFEQKHSLKFPDEYRHFLLTTNGGRPEPNHLKLKSQGVAFPVYVDLLYSMDATVASADLGAALSRHHADGLPAGYAPIGKVRMASGFGGDAMNDLVIGLSGRNAGKVFVAASPAAFMPGMPTNADESPQVKVMVAQMYESCCQLVAPSFSAFLSRLSPTPTKAIPDWLHAIRTNDVPTFLAWCNTGNKLDESFVPYGEMRMLTALDYLALEATPEFLKELLAHSVVKPRQLRERWQRWDLSLRRFKDLMSICGNDLLPFAFATPGVFDDSALLEQLLAAGVDLETAIDEEGSTPLHMAVRNGRADGVRWLLAHGVSSSKPDQYARTAILWAESERQLECLKILMEAGETLESIFPHMKTWNDKLRLIKSRWMNQFDALADYLRSRGLPVDI